MTKSIISFVFGFTIGFWLLDVYGHDNRISWEAEDTGNANGYLVTVQIDGGPTHWPVAQVGPDVLELDHLNPPQFDRYCYSVWSLSEKHEPVKSIEKVCFIRTSSVEWPE